MLRGPVDAADFKTYSSRSSSSNASAIKKFADATNKKASEFYTPRSVVRLIFDMLDPCETESTYERPAAPAVCCWPPWRI
ncbi:N-6 DNA methylase [uncultured Thiodictyon sp.]|uniref:N-6 DNA methylase n=1 Tax=uncultured Thiodictyon sp. TaxID=1846217 RepID=UPI0025D44007|nr:N-6 DNA methylase [uncultured Thiodictyon sp.]